MPHRVAAFVISTLIAFVLGPGAAVAVTATAAARTFTYDAPTVARVDVHEIVAGETGPWQLRVAREWSVSSPLRARGVSTTPLPSFIATNTADDFVDLASPARRTHILDGDATGGSHLWPGNPGKTPFPQGWSGDKIMHEVSDIATDPIAWQNAVPQGSRTVLTGTRGGVDIRVIVDTNTGEIISGYPTNLPRNP
jgi:hypothetical protein